MAEETAARIHETAVIDPSVNLPPGMKVGPYCVIGPDVVFTGPCILRERVSVHGPAVIGGGCEFFPGAVIGIEPQDTKFSGERTEIKIGAGNIFREYVTVHRGTQNGGGVTSIGERNLFMACSHVAHDCHIGNDVVLANYVGLSGHVTIEDYAVIGGQTGVIQFARIGTFSHIGGQMRITKDVAPYCRVAGDTRPGIIGVNTIGMERRGVDPQVRQTLKQAILILTSTKLTTREALEKIEREFSGGEVSHLVEFVRSSEIGIHK